MKEGKPRVLVGIVTYEGKDYMFDKCLGAVNSFDYPKHLYDVLVVDNSKSLNYSRKLRRRHPRLKVVHMDRGPNSRVALTRSQNYIRKNLLEGSYDYLLFVESDLLPDSQALKRLLEYDKQVVGSTYMIGTGDIQLPCIFFNDVAPDGRGITRQIGTKINPDTGKKRLVKEEALAFLGTGLRQVHGCGFGTTLIRKEIVEEFPFWCDSRFDNKHSDVYWYLDLQRAGIPVYVDTDFIIPHFPTPWTEVKDR